MSLGKAVAQDAELSPVNRVAAMLHCGLGDEIRVALFVHLNVIDLSPWNSLY
jgi:hypothetical protein